MRAAADDERRFVDITEFANERNINGSERKRRAASRRLVYQPYFRAMHRYVVHMYTAGPVLY
jgi:hypothetical protein